MGTNLSQIKVALLPFQHVNAFADLESGYVYISNRFMDDVETNLKHELSHVISGDPDHGPAFRDQLDILGGIQPPDTDAFKQLRKRIGIPASIAGNIGNISGIQNILTDYHLLQAYKKFSRKILSTEGHWEVINEVNGDATKQVIRLYPTPKGAFPVVVVYYPVVSAFRSPQAKMIVNRYVLAEAKIALGHARRKLAGMPTPGGGSINWDGGDLVQEGTKEREDVLKLAIDIGAPLGVYLW